MSEAVTAWTTGVEVLRACDPRETPVVFVADQGTPISAESVAGLGDDDLVRRPFDATELARTLVDAFRRSGG